MLLRIIVLFIIILGHSDSLYAQHKDGNTTVHGRVTDLFGNNLEGATLKFYSRAMFNIPTEVKLVKSAITDSNGNYSLDDLPYGCYLVTAELRGFRYTEVSRVFLGKGGNLLDIGLEVGVITDVTPIEIEGTVREMDMTPMKDATVTLMSAFNPEMVYRTRTDENGKYKFIVNTRSQYLIYAAKAGFEINASITQGEGKEKDFILVPLRDR